MRILVFGAHPDDPSIGCGGTIAKYSMIYGRSIGVVSLTRRDIHDKDFKVIFEEGSKRLGVKRYILLNGRDRFLNYNEPFLKKIVRIIRQYMPDLVFVHAPEDWDRDHKITYELVREAFWLASTAFYPDCGRSVSIKGFMVYEVWSPLANFNYIEDISDVITTKLDVIRMFGHGSKNLKYDKAIEGLNRFRGIMTGLGEFAEVFRIEQLSHFEGKKWMK